MARMLWVLLGLSLLVQSSLCSLEQDKKGCQSWRTTVDGVCCDQCSSGNRLVTRCGKRHQDLCTPCEAGTYTTNSLSYRCTQCTKCIGVQIHLKNCTTTTDTQCGCSEGYTCGDKKCSFCVDKCSVGEEPTSNRECKPCPEGTFNDKVHQYCKPWSTKCPKPNQVIVSKGDAVSDIKCANKAPVTVAPVISTEQPGRTIEKVKKPEPENKEQLYEVIIVVFSLFIIAIIFIILFVTTNLLQKRKKTKKGIIKQPELQAPTDDPRTLIATECSFHEAQQEQGSSTESLNSKESSQQLIV